jgi:brefeldin A-inhibited guanine nucleotide-exchange protein
MEKFAERFTLQNPDVFPSADTAFILAFAVIMLQTDLHNPNIKPEKKMTEDSFVKMNKGISVDGGDLPVEFLKEIFRSIKARPFTLKEDEDERTHQAKTSENGFNDIFGTTGSEERRRKKFKKESAELVESTEKLFKKQKTPNSSAYTNLTSSVNPGDVVKPMFDITWGPLLGALSQILEKANDESSIALCLNGFVYAVRIASHTRTSLAKNTFVNSLAKFTALGSIRELKTRNVESIRTLLSIAIMDGELLGESWMPILQCISQLGRLLFFASGVDSDDNFLNNDTQTVATNQSSVSTTLRLILYHFTSVRNKDMLKFGFLGIKGN